MQLICLRTGRPAGINGFPFDVPQYVEWMNEQPCSNPIVTSKPATPTPLPALAGRSPAAHGPCASLRPRLAARHVFLDACIVQIHRDPLQVLPSLCSSASAARGISSDQVTWRRLGAEFTEAMARGTERAIDAAPRPTPLDSMTCPTRPCWLIRSGPSGQGQKLF